MTYFYYEILSNGNMCNNSTRKPLPTYPHALRFNSSTDFEAYWRAKRSFIQSTKIPESCISCPIGECCGDICGDYDCRVTWRKIWEYVK